MPKKTLEGEFIQNKGGRPTKYKPEMCRQIIEIAKAGGHVSEMMSTIGIGSNETFYNWLEKHEDFKSAYEESKIHSQAFYERILLGIATGQLKGNATAIAMIMNNKFPTDYSRSATGPSTNINIGSINSIESLNSTDLDKRIAALQSKMGFLPQQVERSDDESETGVSEAS